MKIAIADSESMMDFQKVFSLVSNIEEILIEDSVESDVRIMR